MGRLFVLGLVLAACGKSKETCRRESEELAAMFQGMDTHLGIHTKFVKLVRRDELPIAPDEDGQVIEFSAEGARMAWRFEEPGDVKVVLVDLLERNRKLPRLLIAIDAATPWERVVELVAALEEAQVQEFSLVFARKPKEQQAPPRSTIDDRLDAAEKAEPADRATKLAEVAVEVVRDCESIKKLFSAVGSEGSKGEVMMEGLPPALIECNCKCDVAALKSMMFRIMVNRDPTTSLRVRLGGDDPEITLPGKTPWAEASKSITGGAISVRVAK